MDAMTSARGESVDELVADMLEAAGKALHRHGGDPKAHVVLSAAAEGFIDEIDKRIFPGFRAAMIEILQMDQLR